MWFKNLRIYRFTKPFDMSAEELQTHLADKPFNPCGRQDLTKYGWGPPIEQAQAADQEPQFVHACNGFLMLCAKREDKVIPASVVKEAVLERSQHIEQKEH